MARGSDFPEHEFQAWLPHYRARRVRLALEAVALVGASYADEMERADRAHHGRLSQRRQELVAAIADYIDAKRSIDEYDEIELHACRSAFQAMGGKIPE